MVRGRDFTGRAPRTRHRTASVTGGCHEGVLTDSMMLGT